MKETEVHQVIYRLFVTQIEFGAYGCGDPLPKIEETSRWFSVSLDTVRSAYLRLKQEGYIRLSKRSGATVIPEYDAQEIRGHIQTFFSARREAALDLCRCLTPLFSRLQWFALKNAGPEQLDEMEGLCPQEDILPPYIMIRHLQLMYGVLENDVLMRLVWHGFMFFQLPFLTLPQNRAPFEAGGGTLLSMITLCRRKDWEGLWKEVESFQLRLSAAINQFYEMSIAPERPGDPVPFLWNPYQKSSQLCYSLAMDLLLFTEGSYSEGDFLPSPAVLAQNWNVSVSTVRRTLTLLNQLGATRSVNGIGTQVLNTEHSAKNCDFSNPVIQKRLLDFVQSLQILALTCKSCAGVTFASMDAPSFLRCREGLLELKCKKRYESIVYTTLGFICRFAPADSIRTIYGQLRQILLWGYPLRGIHGSRERVNEFYLPYLDSIAQCLEGRDGEGLSALLERLMIHEFKFAVGQLRELGIAGALPLAVPEEETGSALS